MDTPVIDCDGHILEPPDLWEKYLEPKYRDRAMRICVGDDGYEYLEIDNKRAKLTRPGALGMMGGMGKGVETARTLREQVARGEVRPEDVRALRPGPELTYLKGAAFGTMDMKNVCNSSIAKGWPRRSSIQRSDYCGKLNSSTPSSRRRIAARITAGLPISAGTQAD